MKDHDEMHRRIWINFQCICSATGMGSRAFLAWILLQALVANVSSLGPDVNSLADANALMAFKAQIWDDKQAIMANWKVTGGVGSHACQFTGVICDPIGYYRVYTLKLADMGLKGTISPSIGTLSLLVNLNLTFNELTGSIPSGLGSCPQLQLLDLSHNQLSGTVPTQLGSLVQLKKLYLGWNRFTGNVGFATTMTALNYLNVKSNLMSGSPFPLLSGLRNLTSIDIAFNSFSGTIDSNDLAPLNSSLQFLWIAQNNFVGDLPTGISYLVGLKKIDFSSNNFTGGIPPELQFCPNLTHVNMSYNLLTGHIPGAALGMLQGLQVLHLQGNSLSGSIPAGLLNCQNLTDLELGQNLLTGTIPAGLGAITTLVRLNLSSNQLGGTIPPELGNLRSLAYLNLSHNNLSGTIPSAIQDLPRLHSLSLASNRLLGGIPQRLGTVTSSLSAVDLSSNSLSGPIPHGVAYSALTSFTVSDNQLEGEIPDTVAMRRFSPFGFTPGNDDLCGDVIGRSCKPGLKTWEKALMGALIPAGALAAAAALLGFFLWSPTGPYSPTVLRNITDDFNNSNLVGIGGVSTVYKGVYPNGDTVAVKRLRPEYFSDNKADFDVERKALLKVEHPNIVKVRGSCASGNLRALVMEYMPNGNLDMHLHQGGESNLSWDKRLQTAGGTAQALAYLHGEWQGATPMQCDIKGTSILFDENFKPKLTDIRMAMPSSSGTTGSSFNGYMPPEYALSGPVTPAGDVYSYGTLLLELLTGTKPEGVMLAEAGGLPGLVGQAFPDNLESVIDPKLLQTVGCNDQVALLTKTALQCTQALPHERPTAQEVLGMLEQVYSVDPMPPPVATY